MLRSIASVMYIEDQFTAAIMVGLIHRTVTVHGLIPALKWKALCLKQFMDTSIQSALA